MKSDPTSLWQQVSTLPSPEDFWNGRRIADGLAPDNILLFSRSYSASPDRGSLGHYHPRYVLDLVLEGEGALQIEQQTFQLATGEAALVFPHQFHAGGTAPGYNLARWAVTTFDLADDRIIQPLRNTPRKLRPVDLALYASLLEAWQKGQSGVEVSAGLAQLLISLCQAPAITTASSSAALPQPDWISEITHLVAEKGLYTVGEIAPALGLSEERLRTRYRQATGKSLPGFLRTLRLEKAVRLLEEPDLTISDIAERLRFSSVQTFSRVFKAAYGLPPKKYEGMVQHNLNT